MYQLKKLVELWFLFVLFKIAHKYHEMCALYTTQNCDIKFASIKNQQRIENMLNYIHSFDINVYH